MVLDNTPAKLAMVNLYAMLLPLIQQILRHQVNFSVYNVIPFLIAYIYIDCLPHMNNNNNLGHAKFKLVIRIAFHDTKVIVCILNCMFRV